MKTTIFKSWQEVWASKAGRRQIILGLLLLAAILAFMPSFFNRIEKRNGTTLADPILDIIPPHDVGPEIFLIIFCLVLFMLFRSINRPQIFITYVWGLAFVTIARLSAIASFPLNPPRGVILLVDPVTNVLYGHRAISKDLFFSGHTAMVVLVALNMEKKTDRIIAWIASLLVALLLLVQHIHYTIDVVFAPVIVYILHVFTKRLLRWKWWFGQG